MGLEGSEHLDNLEQFVTNAFVNDAKGTVLTGTSLDEVASKVESARTSLAARTSIASKSNVSDLSDITSFFDLLLVWKRKRLLAEFDDFVCQNQDAEGIGELAVTFSKVVKYSRSPKLTRNLMDVVAWYEGRDSFDDLVTTIDALFDHFDDKHYFVNDRVNAFSIRKLTNVLKLCYDEHGEDHLARALKFGFKNYFQSESNDLLNFIFLGHDFKKSLMPFMLKILDKYHNLEGVGQLSDKILSMDTFNIGKDKSIFLSKDLEQLINLYQGNAVVGNVVQYLGNRMRYPFRISRYTKLFSNPEILKELDTFDPKYDLAEVFDCIAVASNGKLGDPALKFVFQVSKEYYDKYGGDQFISLLYTYLRMFKKGDLDSFTTRTRSFTLPEVKNALNHYQILGGNWVAKSIVKTIMSYDQEEDLGHVKKISSFFEKYSRDPNIFGYVELIHRYVTENDLDRVFDIIYLCDNNRKLEKISKELLDNYFSVFRTSIKDDQLIDSLPPSTISKLNGAYELFKNVVRYYPVEERSIAHQQFFEILNEKISYGDTLESKRMIIREWSHNLQELIKNNSSDLNFIAYGGQKIGQSNVQSIGPSSVQSNVQTAAQPVKFPRGVIVA